MPKVFMCHATPDKPEVEWVANTLLGLRPELEFWIDSWSLVPGDSLVGKINEGLSSADRLVVFLTPSSVTSNWVRKELEAGIVLGIAKERGFKGDNFVIPVVFKALPADYQVPPLLAPTLYADFTTTQFDAACAHLLRGILGTPAGPSGTRLTNLEIRWEHFAPPGRPGLFGMRLTFSARLTPEHMSYIVHLGQPYLSVTDYFGSPMLGGSRSGVWMGGDSDCARGIFRASIDQPRITPDRPFVVELISDKRWTHEPSVQGWTPWLAR